MYLYSRTTREDIIYTNLNRKLHSATFTHHHQPTNLILLYPTLYSAVRYVYGISMFIPPSLREIDRRSHY